MSQKNESFVAREERILRLWNEQDIFNQSVQRREKAPLFTFYDGPPFATGLPHYGHLLAGTIKDVVLRYKTMKGFFVPRRFGWDCHGLPIEQEIEKAQGLGGATSIEKFGIARFNEECRQIVLRYTKEWQTIVERMGRWVSFDQTYHTMDPSFMESVWWVFKQLYQKGLVYEGYKVMPFSAKLGTPLSNFEAGENYQEVDDPALTVLFPLEGEPDTAFLAWTTTPWTLISHMALMVGPHLAYVKLQYEGKKYWMAKARVAAHFAPDTYEILDEVEGEQLVGMRYAPPFDYFTLMRDQGAFTVIAEETVSMEEGTGIVHAAPAFGEVDFYACQRNQIPLVCPVDNNGCFTQPITEYKGLFVKEADKSIAQRLKVSGKLFHQATIRHRYPFCWRSDTPLIYKAVRTWFIAVEKIKTALIAANQQVHWTPAHIKEGRFGKWLEGARDWAISRNRYWGTPIPLWRSDAGDILVMGSREELEKYTGHTPQDLHRHFIDSLEIQHEGKTYRRIPEVFDCWFESGSMPYSQNHYPFENQALFEASFPADFIAEGLDQTRGWFYTLMVLSTALFDKPAFKHVVVNGIILAEDGSKMSKRLRNYPDPMEVVHKYGADAIRLYMLHSPAVRADDLCFTETGVELVLRQILIPLWNAYSFFDTYASLYHFVPTPVAAQKSPTQKIDQWILSLTHKLLAAIELGMEQYDLSVAVEPLVTFIDQLTNWYIRRSRRRFWEDQATPDRQEAFETLYYVLMQVAKMAAPFIPFLAEALYQGLRRADTPASVHLCDYPAYQEQQRDLQLEVAMDLVQQAVSLGHALRKEHKLKVRQPLLRADIACDNPAHVALLEEHRALIAEELNVKEVVLLADSRPFVEISVKPNFRVLGKRVGKRLPAFQAALEQLEMGEKEMLFGGKAIVLQVEGAEEGITPDEVQIHRTVRPGFIAQTDRTLTVALETTLTESLLLEGLARELVNKINTMRRDQKLHVSDRIGLVVDTSDRVQQAYEAHKEWICSEVLARKVQFMGCTEGVEWDLNGERAKVQIAVLG